MSTGNRHTTDLRDTLLTGIGRLDHGDTSFPERRPAPTPARPLMLAPLDQGGVIERYAPVIRRIARDKHILRRGAQRRFVEMLRFLDICAQSTETVSPPPRIDDAWHTFVLFTRDYGAYCEERFGFFVHHDPMESRDPLAYERAYAEARTRFGELDRRVWPRPGTGIGSGGGGGGGGGGWFDGFGCGGGGCGGGG